MSVCRALLWAAVVFWVTPAGAAQLPKVTLDGRAYVELARLARTLHTTLDATPSGTRAYLRTPGHVVKLTRNWAQVTVDGGPVVLNAPVRVKSGIWLVPAAFLTVVVPKLRASGPAASPRLTAAPPPRPAAAATPPDVTVDEVRFRSYPSFTRVVVETSDTVTYRVEPRGARETRVRLTSVAVEPRVDDVRDGFVDRIRVERDGTDALLIVAFQAQAGEVKASTLADPPRLVLDFMRPAERVAREERAELGPLKLMVLDAGHGGHDSGAIGPTGLMEKDVVLDVTRRVAHLVEDRLGIRVALSRDADYFVPLRERTSFANRERADVFVSIHANAHREIASEGVEIYFLSSEATDIAARQVAARENSVIQLEKTSPSAKKGLEMVKSILWDLAQSEFQFESEHLAEILLDSITRSLHIPNRGVKQAGFYVLGGAAMPAVLIEIGFVTNPKEERKLRDPRYRDEIAHAIVEGLAQYKRHWDERTRTALDRGRANDAAR